MYSRAYPFCFVFLGKIVSGGSFIMYDLGVFNCFISSTRSSIHLGVVVYIKECVKLWFLVKE